MNQGLVIERAKKGFAVRMAAFVAIILLLIALPYGINAQATPEVQNTVWYGGLKSESGDVRVVSGGGGRVSGSNFWLLGYTTVGQYDTGEDEQEGAIGAEVAYLYPVNDKLSVGLIVSPLNIDWENIGTAGVTTYIANTTGAVLYWSATKNFGLGLSGKYKWDFPTGTELKEKTAWAAVITYKP